MKIINKKKLEDVLRNSGVIFFSSGAIGFFFQFSLLGSIGSVSFGLLLIFFGIKENNRGNK